jgi:hypothetical protein
MSRPGIEVNRDELDAMIDRATRAPLSGAEAQKLKTAVHVMAERLLWSRTTEKTKKVLPADPFPAEKAGAGPSAPAGQGRHPVSAFTGAQRVPMAHATLQSGDRCPECGQGKVYRQEPVMLVQFVGRPPLEATILEKERLRCNACQQIFTAVSFR